MGPPSVRELTGGPPCVSVGGVGWLQGAPGLVGWVRGWVGGISVTELTGGRLALALEAWVGFRELTGWRYGVHG